MRTSLLALSLMVGCKSSGPDPQGVCTDLGGTWQDEQCVLPVVPLVDDTPNPDEPMDADGDGVPANADCDDGDPSVYPGAPERCDAIDHDCDGANGGAHAIDALVWYLDDDDDGFGVDSATLRACDEPSGYARVSGDCDDGDDSVHPGATEVCDTSGVDEDCDGRVNDLDEGVEGQSTFYRDADADGFGDPGQTISACERPIGFVLDDTDCDDSTSTTAPNRVEVCGGLDENCDGLVDEADPNLDPTTLQVFYTDTDGDGYGVSVLLACSLPAAAALQGGDCDDTTAQRNPGLIEQCTGRDDDCDGLVDTADPSLAPGEAGTWWLDADGDHYGDPAKPIIACTQPLGTATTPNDCDDSRAESRPGGEEWCNGEDDDCNGLVDDKVRFAGTLTPSCAMATLVGTTALDHAGQSLAATGDLDADGTADLLVGVPTASSTGPLRGYMVVVHGPLAGRQQLSEHLTLGLTTTGGTPITTGSRVLAGDVDGDGAIDFLGLRYRTLSVLYGPLDGNGVPAASGVLRAGTGWSLGDIALCDDANGDGHLDIALGTNEAVWRTSEPILGDIYVDSTSAIDTNANAALGAAVGCADFDGDGTTEVAGALGNTNPHIYYSTAPAWIPVMGSQDRFGSALATGDLDGDGVQDLVLGAPLYDAGWSMFPALGAAYVYYGPISSNPRWDTAVFGKHPGDSLGDALAILPGLFGGQAALAVSAPASDYQNATSPGEVLLFTGALGSHIDRDDAKVILRGDEPGDHFGISVALVGDVDGDGLPELAVGADRASLGAPLAGAIYLFTVR